MKSMCKNACYLILILVMGWAFYEFTCDVIAKRDEMIEYETLLIFKAKAEWNTNKCDAIKDLPDFPAMNDMCQGFKKAMDKDPKK